MLDLPASFERDAQTIFDAYVKALKRGAALSQNGADSTQQFADVATRIAWLAGLYFTLVLANCDDWDERSREDVVKMLWDYAGSVAIATEVDFAGKASIPDPGVSVPMLRKILESPDAEDLLEYQPRAMQHLIIAAITPVIAPGATDDLDRLIVNGRVYPCDPVLYWARKMGAQQAEDDMRRMTTRPQGISLQEMSALIRKRLGAPLSWTQVGNTMNVFNDTYAAKMAMAGA